MYKRQLNQVFEHVAQLLVPEASVPVLEASLKSATDRMAELRANAFRQGQKSTLERLNKPQKVVVELERDIAAAKGGDADAAPVSYTHLDVYKRQRHSRPVLQSPSLTADHPGPIA